MIDCGLLTCSDVSRRTSGFAVIPSCLDTFDADSVFTISNQPQTTKCTHLDKKQMEHLLDLKSR